MANTENTSISRLSGTLWLGTAGAGLILTGIISLLAANWHFVPFPLQLAFALTPLLVAWFGAVWFMRKGFEASLAFEEILGIIWTGGIISTITILGRVLQLSSGSFSFCLIVTLLLLPVMLLLRSTVAWLLYSGFAFSASLAAEDTAWGELGGALLIALFTGIAICRLAGFWKEDSIYNVTQRFLAALASFFPAIAFTSLCMEFLDDAIDLPYSAANYISIVLLAWPLILGLLSEKTPRFLQKSLTLCGAILLGGASLLHTFIRSSFAEEGSWIFDKPQLLLHYGWLLLVVVALILVFRKKLLHDEGYMLLLVPGIMLATIFNSTILGVVVNIAVAAIIMGIAIVGAKRYLANITMVFLVITMLLTFTALETGMFSQGVTFLLSGGGFILLNRQIDRMKKGGSHE